MKKITLFTFLPLAAALLMACNGIETVGLNAESVSVNKKKSLIVRDINVSQNEAIGIANMFAHSNGGSDIPQTKGAFLSTKMISSSETIKEDGQNLMYVFNYEGGGFVIVGSTRNYYPILAYSDEGSFIVKDDMGPVDVWLDETKVSIKNSNLLDNETKAQMHNLWDRYDVTFVDPAQELLATRRPQTRSVGEDYCWQEIENLQALYGDEDWTFLPLSFVEDIFDDAGLSSYYDDICYYAIQNNSALNETVIGYKTFDRAGPLLETQWHQDAPFNILCPNNYPAGCGAIAVAQVMKYWEYPPSMSLDGINITWSQIPINASSSSKQPHLIRMVGDILQMNYGQNGSGTDYTNVKDGLLSLGYIVKETMGYNYTKIRDTLFIKNKPVIMFGQTTQNGGSKHIWVCDGVKETMNNRIIFYTENQPNGTGTFTQGMYSHDNPGYVGGIGSPYCYFNMNWGMAEQDLFRNGWYLGDSANSGNGNFQYGRTEIIITAP